MQSLFLAFEDEFREHAGRPAARRSSGATQIVDQPALFNPDQFDQATTTR